MKNFLKISTLACVLHCAFLTQAQSTFAVFTCDLKSGQTLVASTDENKKLTLSYSANTKNSKPIVWKLDATALSNTGTQKINDGLDLINLVATGAVTLKTTDSKQLMFNFVKNKKFLQSDRLEFSFDGLKSPIPIIQCKDNEGAVFLTKAIAQKANAASEAKNKDSGSTEDAITGAGPHSVDYLKENDKQK